MEFDPKEQSLPPGMFWSMILVLYLPMIAAVPFVKPPGDFRITDAGALWQGLAVAAIAGLGSVMTVRAYVRHTVWGRQWRTEMHGLFRDLGPGPLLAAVMLSAFGEEILFRGILYPRFGLLWSAFAFALLVFPLRRWLLPWCAAAFVISLGLGWATQQFGTLWPAIFYRFILNHHLLNDLAQPNPSPQAPTQE